MLVICSVPVSLQIFLKCSPKSYIAFFVYGFAKKERGNIDAVEAKEFKTQAKLTLALNDEQILKLLGNGTYHEVTCDEKG